MPRGSAHPRLMPYICRRVFRSRYDSDDTSKEVIRLASNQVEEFRRARDARIAAEKAGASSQDIAVLKAAEAAKKAQTPGGRGMD